MRLFAQKPATPPADDLVLPRGVRMAGAWSWRLLAVAGVAALAFWLIAQLRIIVIPLLVAALIAALMTPMVDWLQRHKWPRGLGVAAAMLLLIAIVTGLFWFAVAQIRSGYPDLQRRALSFWEDLKTWLLESPLHLTEGDINDYMARIAEAVQRDMNVVFSQALSVGSSLGHFVVGILLTLFATLFLLLDGRGIWAWIVRLFPRRAERPVDTAARAGWVTLGNFVRVQVLVAAIDAIGIGVGAWILGLFYPPGMPLVIPIAILVFLGSFIPVIGAVATGALAVFVALVTLGPIPALIMVGIVLVVQQVEGHVLQPLIMGSAVKVHPLAVVLAVAAGSIVAGIPGALFAVPIVAFCNVAISAIATGAWRDGPARAAAEVRAHDEAVDDASSSSRA